MKTRNILTLLSAIILCEAVGATGSLFTISSISTWYLALNKPAFTPPNWAFAPVWTSLYLLMGVSLYIILSKRTKKDSQAVQISAFGIQLALNLLWSLVFFGLRSTVGGFVVIVALLAAIAATMLAFWKASRAASLILTPYLAWVAIAASLNLYVWLLNP
ncbi:MAG: tryptophan-rich sensory protein [Candidatus Micrarchaeota archaeon]|nr:tryptophan-rich sensory protein [Candidatus Micrarchaeota archaeon]